MKEQRQGFNERKFLLEIKEFKKKKVIHELTKKIENKQKDVHKEISKVYDQRLEKLRHNTLTNNHLSQYIADLNFRLYSLPEKDKSLTEDEIKLIQNYTEIISLLDKYQNLKAEKILTDKKELEDRIMERSLEEQNKELSALHRQEKYEKYIYDKLVQAQQGLIDICQQYREQVHLCEQYEMNSLKLKSELDLYIDTNKKLKNILERLKLIEKKLKEKLNFQENNNIKIFEPIYSKIGVGINNKIIKKNQNKTINIKEENYYKIDLTRPKSSIRFNKSKSNLILDKHNTFGFNKKENNSKLKLTTNNFIKLGTPKINTHLNIHKFIPNKSKNFRRTFNRKISIREKSLKQKSASNFSTNYLTKTRNKSMIDIKQTTNINNEDIFDKNYLEYISHFLIDKINKQREEIKMKMKYKAEEIRSRYQIKYMISNIIDDIQNDIEKIKRDKDFDINKYYDNLFGHPQNKEMKQLDNMLFEKKVETSGQQLYILTYILDNCFNGINYVKSIFREDMI